MVLEIISEVLQKPRFPNRDLSVLLHEFGVLKPSEI